MTDLLDRVAYPNFMRLTEAILDVWPKHRRYLEKNISERTVDELKFSEMLSGMILKLSENAHEGLPSLAADYRFISEQIILPEELHFRRTGQYRLKTFKECVELVYSRVEFMSRYMSGLLVTDVIWLNHCRSMKHYYESFLPSVKENADLLEIGPGHGLLLSLATNEARVGAVSAWDVSSASLELSRQSLATLSPEKSASFRLRNIFDDAPSEERFDAIVFSEVLEHLERPKEALAAIHGLCRPGGKVWLNVPANSPAPDHLYLIQHPDEAAELMRSVGFEIVDVACFAMSGTTLERALREKLTINCVVIGQRAE